MLRVRARDRLIVHKSDLDVSVWIVIDIALMESDVALSLIQYLLSSLSSQELIEFFIGHVIVCERLF